MNTQICHNIYQPYRIFSKVFEEGEAMAKGKYYFDGKKGRFYVMFKGNAEWFYSDPDRHKPFFSKEETKYWFKIAKSEIEERIFQPKAWRKNSPLHMDIYAKEWLDILDVSRATKESYYHAVIHYIIPFFRSQDIRHIGYMDIVKFKKWLSEKHNLSSKTIYNKVNTLKRMLKDAWKARFITEMPPFPSLGYDKPEIQYLSMEQQQKFIDAIPDRDRPIFQFMMEYGTRPQEARALQKDCVKDGYIRICRVFSLGEDLRETTKSGDKGKRWLKITPYIEEVLNNIPPHLGPFVFVNEQGLPYKRNELTNIWRKAKKITGIEIKLYNACRHSLGCQLLDEGQNIDVVKDLLGHTDIRMTERYAKRSKAKASEVLKDRRKVINFKKKAENP